MNSESHHPIVDIRNLTVTLHSPQKKVYVLREVSFPIYKGRVLGIVGESGSGKSVLSRTLVGLSAISKTCEISGEIIFADQNMIDLGDEQLQQIRGKDISLIMQNSRLALNPNRKIGKQMVEVTLERNSGMKLAAARDKAIAILDEVGVSNPSQVMQAYAYQLSGGICQRVMIAMALMEDPSLLIADEPTSAVDPTVQIQIVTLLKKLQKNRQMSVVIITHDLSLLANFCDDVVVMYAGRVVEYGDVNTIFSSPMHPYTVGLMQSLPSMQDFTQKRLLAIKGNPPELTRMIVGCPFYDRCDYRVEECKNKFPDKKHVASGHWHYCLREINPRHHSA